MPRAAVLAIAQSELRRHWRSMVVLGMLAGLVGAVVVSSVAVARRTASAHQRLVAATHLDDARVLITSTAVSPAEVEALPGIQKVWRTRQVIGQLLGAPGVTYANVSAGHDRPADLFTPVIVQGRPAHDDAPDEVIVPEAYASEVGIRLGDTIRLKLLTPTEVTQFDTGFGEPDGPLVTLHVVGVFRADRAWLGNGVGPLFATAAFYDAHRPSQVGYDLLLRIRGGSAGVARFRDALEPLGRRTPTDAAGREFGVLSTEFPRSLREPAISAARRTLGVGLLVFLTVAALGGVLAVAQGLGRHHALGAAEQRVEAALGLTRSERVAARLLPGLLGAAVASVLAVTGALATAGIEPLGALGRFEPTPGWRPDLPAIALSTLATALTFLAVTAVTAARVLPRSAQSPAPSGSATRRLGVLGRAAPTVAGLSFALSGGRGRAATPVRTTLVAAVLGVVGVVAVGAFGSSLRQLEHEPARYGWTGDFAIADLKPETLRALQQDRRIADVAVVRDTTARVNDEAIDTVSVTQSKGQLPFTLLEGRAPTAMWEIALGSRIARRLSVEVGDVVTFAGRDHTDHRGRVVGIVVNPDVNDIGLGASSVVTGQTQAAIGEVTPFATGLVRAAPGTDVNRLFGELSQHLEMQRRAPPQDVRNLLDLGRLPTLLTLFLAVVAASVLAHGLLVTTRRRARDLAVLRAIGFTPRQVGASLVTAASTAAAVGLVVGVPLGLAVARVVWFEVASGIGVAGDLAVPAPL
ncbi:MAG: FtsX-like permease family protein, partial [Actinomycetes bacterium]